MQAHGFRVCFTPLLEVLFTFPSRYLCAIGLSVVFSLAGWAPQIPAEFLVLRGTQVPARPDFRFRVRGSHPLRPRFPPRSATVCPSLLRRSYNPDRALTRSVWAPARSLATTCAITFVFSSCGYLDVSVPRVRPALSAVWASLPTGFPIRTPPGLSVFAARRRFSQLVTSFFASESHRHPPCALVRLSLVFFEPYEIYCQVLFRSILSFSLLADFRGNLMPLRSCVSRSHHVNDLKSGG